MGLMLVFVACNNDSDLEPDSSVNVNSNATTVINGVTESPNATNLQQAACRLEMPQLKGGDDNLFIVHTVPTYGINYSMEYDRSLRAQRWAAYQWHAGNSGGSVGRSETWQEDPLIPSKYRTTLADHQSNGYDRGHMVGSADRQMSVAANEQTYYLSNMHPQLRGFNSRINESHGYSIWYNLENRLRNSYNINNFRDTLYVVKGGTIDRGNYKMVKGRGNSLVCPNYFFMAILRKKNSDKTQGGYAAIGFWMEHKENTTKISDTDFAKYAVSIERLETLTGIDFFCNLPDDIEKKVESNLVLSVWKL